jgi:hypothetical protein
MQPEDNTRINQAQRLPPPPPPPIFTNTSKDTIPDELPPPPEEIFKEEMDNMEFPKPSDELLNYDDQNYYVNFNEGIEEQDSGYINVNALQSNVINIENESNNLSSNVKSSIIQMRPNSQSNTLTTNKNRISTFLDDQGETPPDNKQKLNQAIVLGAFKLKKTAIDNSRKEKSTEHFLAREPNVLSILTMASENCINDGDNDDEDDDDW